MHDANGATCGAGDWYAAYVDALRPVKSPKWIEVFGEVAPPGWYASLGDYCYPVAFGSKRDAQAVARFFQREVGGELEAAFAFFRTANLSELKKRVQIECLAW